MQFIIKHTRNNTDFKIKKSDGPVGFWAVGVSALSYKHPPSQETLRFFVIDSKGLAREYVVNLNTSILVMLLVLLDYLFCT